MCSYGKSHCSSKILKAKTAQQSRVSPAWTHVSSSMEIWKLPPWFGWTPLEPSPATGVENGSLDNSWQCLQLTCSLLRRRSRLDRIRPSLRTGWWEIVWESWVRWDPHTGVSWYGNVLHTSTFREPVLWQQWLAKCVGRGCGVLFVGCG